MQNLRQSGDVGSLSQSHPCRAPITREVETAAYGAVRRAMGEAAKGGREHAKTEVRRWDGAPTPKEIEDNDGGHVLLHLGKNKTESAIKHHEDRG
jgi:hypothetical protein